MPAPPRRFWFACAAIALLGTLLLNARLYAFFLRRNGAVFAAGCVPLHLLYLLYSGLSYVYVWFGFRLRPKLSQRNDAPSALP